MALNTVINPYEYFNDPNVGRPIFNGDIYVGEIDLDPEIPANQKQVSAKQEDGTIVPISQPVKTNSGGNPTYNGSPVVLLVNGNYSIRVNDSQGNQEFYQANVNNGVPATKDEVYILYDTADAAASDTGLSVGEGVATLGRSSINDTGGGFYLVVAGGTGTNDGGLYIDMSNGNQLFLISGIRHVRHWGAAGDGVTDDSSAFDNMDAALGYVLANAGDYRINTNTTISGDIEFLAGASMNTASGITFSVSGAVKASDTQMIFGGSTTGIYSLSVDSAPIHWFGTVQQAVNAMAANKTLLIYEDIAFNDTNITKRLNFVGVGREYAQIQGTWAVTDLGGNSTFNNCRFNQPSTGTVICNIAGSGGLNFRDCQMVPGAGNTMFLWNHTAGSGGSPRIIELMQTKFDNGKLCEQLATGATYIFHVKEESLFTFSEADTLTPLIGGFIELDIYGGLTNINDPQISSNSSCVLRFLQGSSVDDNTTSRAWRDNNGTGYDTLEVTGDISIRAENGNYFHTHFPIFEGNGVPSANTNFQQLVTDVLITVDADKFDVVFYEGAVNLTAAQTWQISGGQEKGQTLETRIIGTLDSQGNNVNVYGRIFNPASNQLGGLTVVSTYNGTSWVHSYSDVI